MMAAVVGVVKSYEYEEFLGRRVVWWERVKRLRAPLAPARFPAHRTFCLRRGRQLPVLIALLGTYYWLDLSYVKYG